MLLLPSTFSSAAADIDHCDLLALGQVATKRFQTLHILTKSNPITSLTYHSFLKKKLFYSNQSINFQLNITIIPAYIQNEDGPLSGIEAVFMKWGK